VYAYCPCYILTGGPPELMHAPPLMVNVDYQSCIQRKKVGAERQLVLSSPKCDKPANGGDTSLTRQSSSALTRNSRRKTVFFLEITNSTKFVVTFPLTLYLRRYKLLGILHDHFLITVKNNSIFKHNMYKLSLHAVVQHFCRVILSST